LLPLRKISHNQREQCVPDCVVIDIHVLNRDAS
jgi:hypothetical protein